MTDRRTAMALFATSPFAKLPTVSNAKSHAGRKLLKHSRPPNSRSIMWRRVLDDLSFEHMIFEPHDEKLSVSGTVLIADKAVPQRVDYFIECGTDWRTKRVKVTQLIGIATRTLRLERFESGDWMLDGTAAPHLRGCTDVDLGVSPSTNALAINRLGLSMGEVAQIRAAWVQFPSLAVSAVDQSYERTAASHYIYRSLGSGFHARLSVDDQGFPGDYEGVWRRIAASAPGSDQSASLDNQFPQALVAPAPNLALGTAADDFSWLIGGWRGDFRDFDSSGEATSTPGEWWFSWVLEGRAIQDIILAPGRSSRTAEALASTHMRIGTTIRTFDLATQLWRIFWITPKSGLRNELSGRRRGNRIVLLGVEGEARIRWSFNDITDNSFRWLGETQAPDGRWALEAEFLMKRIH